MYAPACLVTESDTFWPLQSPNTSVTLDWCLTVKNKFPLIQLPPKYPFVFLFSFALPTLPFSSLRRQKRHLHHRHLSLSTPKCLYARLSQPFSFCCTTLAVLQTTIHLNLDATNFRHLFLSITTRSCSRAQHEDPLCCGKTCYCKVSSPDTI